MNAWIGYQLYSVSESLATKIEGIKKGDQSGSFSDKELERVAHEMAEQLIVMAKQKWEGKELPGKVVEMVNKLEKFLAGEAPELNQKAYELSNTAA